MAKSRPVSVSTRTANRRNRGGIGKQYQAGGLAGKTHHYRVAGSKPPARLVGWLCAACSAERTMRHSTPPEGIPPVAARETMHFGHLQPLKWPSTTPQAVVEAPQVAGADPSDGHLQP